MSRPTLRTELCDRIGIEYPIVLAGMGPVAGTGAPVSTANLVAAVSNAGGLGIIGGVAFSPEDLRSEIRKVRSLTDKPFGVDLLLSSNFLVPRGASAMPSAPPVDRLPQRYPLRQRVGLCIAPDLSRWPARRGRCELHQP